MAWTYALSGFDLERQGEGEWCWAAVTVGVSQFYNSASTLDQCHLAKALCVGGTACECCNDGASTECNQPRPVQDALNITKNWADGPVPVGDDLDGMMSRIASELQQGRPVIAELAWPGDIGAHVVVIAAIDLTNQQLHILDPSSDGETHDLGYQDFHYIYKGNGTWTNSFFTCSKQVGNPSATAGEAAGASEAIAAEIHEKLSSAVRGLRLRSRVIEPASVVVREHPACPVYSISLDALIHVGLNAAVKTGMRTLIETTGGTAAVEVHMRPDGTVGGAAVGHGSVFKEMRASLRRASERLRADTKIEIRVLRIPSLHLEGLWLSAREPNDDVVYIPHSSLAGVRGRAYTRQEIEAILRKVGQETQERRRVG